MDTQVRTPQMVFMQPQRLMVPLFQRPYVWNEDDQWEPLWSDITRVADRLLAEPTGRHQPHFLGAVVLQQVLNPLGGLQERTIIDGQQRLTTLQLLLDALQAELEAVHATQPARRIEMLVANAEAYRERAEDRFKVWPTNRDRAAFNAVMAAAAPVDHDALAHHESRLVQAHAYFSQRSREWLSGDTSNAESRAVAIERVVRELLQIVVIDLDADENAQEIFETLNARGAQLTAADLIKNFVFQRLTEDGVDVQTAYEQYWKHFETGFWEAEISSGRVRGQRSSVFLNHWLIAKTGEEILAREVFARFKRYANHDAGVSMLDLLGQLHRASEVYARFITAAHEFPVIGDRLGLFAYRTGVLESEVVKPLVLLLLDPDAEAVPPQQVIRALETVESWMVRRMLVRATTKSYTQVFADLIAQVGRSGRLVAGAAIREALAQQAGTNAYWPDDDEVRRALRELPVYRRLPRGRLRMVLEAIEDHQRGWRNGSAGLGGQRVARATYAIEHVMPRRWPPHWPLPEDRSPVDRDALVDTLGNLTLLTGRLNSKVSNGPWVGSPSGKRLGMQAHDVLLLNRRLLASAGDRWDEDRIQDRTDELITDVLGVWPVPVGHTSMKVPPDSRPKRRIAISDLLSAGLLAPGTTLFAKRSRTAGRTATVLPDGGLDVDGVRYATPSGAARAVSGASENGWVFWLLDLTSRRSLNDLWHEYVDAREIDAEEEES